MNKTLRVLMVDDDLADAMVFCKIIREQAEPIEIEVEHAPERVIASLERRLQGDERALPHLMLLDINMPRLSGFDLKRRIAQSERLALIPTIFLTSSSSDEDVREAYEVGASAFMTKPLHLAEMREAVATIVRFWSRVRYAAI